MQKPIEGLSKRTYLRPIRGSLQKPKRGRSVLTKNQPISMLNFSALKKGGYRLHRATVFTHFFRHLPLPNPTKVLFKPFVSLKAAKPAQKASLNCSLCLFAVSRCFWLLIGVFGTFTQSKRVILLHALYESLADPQFRRVPYNNVY